MATSVVFRKFKDDGQIIAYFPGTYDRGNITTYMHQGQHGEGAPYADYNTVLATEAEYAELKAELVSQGYDDLVVRKRIVRH